MKKNNKQGLATFLRVVGFGSGNWVTRWNEDSCTQIPEWSGVTFVK